MTSEGKVSTKAKGAIDPLRVEAATEQERALAHAHQPVPATRPDWAAEHGIGDRQLEASLTEREFDPGGARSMTSGIGEPLLKDPVGGLIDGAAERSRCSSGADGHVKPRRGVALDQGAERGEPRRSLYDGARRSAVAERADDLVDLGHRLARHLLDRLERQARALGILIVPQPGGAGPDGDHADRVPCGVVKLAGDPGALLGGCEAAFPLCLTLGAQSALLELRDVLASQAGSLAGEPRDGPREAGVEELLENVPSPAAVVARYATKSATTAAVVRLVHGLDSSRLAASR